MICLNFDANALSGIYQVWSGIYQAWSGIYQAWSGIYQVWSGIYQVWSGIYLVWSGIYQAWSGIYQVWSGIYQVWSRIYQQCMIGNLLSMIKNFSRVYDREFIKPNQEYFIRNDQLCFSREPGIRYLAIRTSTD